MYLLICRIWAVGDLLIFVKCKKKNVFFLIQLGVCTRCFILKVDRMLYGVPVSVTSCRCDLLCAAWYGFRQKWTRHPERRAAVLGSTPLCCVYRTEQRLYCESLYTLHLTLKQNKSFGSKLLSYYLSKCSGPYDHWLQYFWTSNCPLWSLLWGPWNLQEPYQKVQIPSFMLRLQLDLGPYGTELNQGTWVGDTMTELTSHGNTCKAPVWCHVGYIYIFIKKWLGFLQMILSIILAFSCHTVMLWNCSSEYRTMDVSQPFQPHQPIHLDPHNGTLRRPFCADLH